MTFALPTTILVWNLMGLRVQCHMSLWWCSPSFKKTWKHWKQCFFSMNTRIYTQDLYYQHPVNTILVWSGRSVVDRCTITSYKYFTAKKSYYPQPELQQLESISTLSKRSSTVNKAKPLSVTYMRVMLNWRQYFCAGMFKIIHGVLCQGWLQIGRLLSFCIVTVKVISTFCQGLFYI